MSKAFTKEDSQTEPEAEGEEGAPLPAGTRNYMTPTGAARMREELHRLLTRDRPELVRVIEWAASNGDRSENADYTYGKRRLREMDRRIRFLTKRLESAEVIDPATQRGDRVLFGATVTVADEEGAEKTYRIVGIDEINPGAGYVSWASPLAKALLNSRAGDSVTLRTPKGEQELEVLRVQYLPLDPPVQSR
jgi:transcription elongation factor GreB